MRKSLGMRIRGFRKLKRLTQQDLARILGITPHNLSSIERGIKKPSYQILERMSSTLGIPLEELLNLDKVSGNGEYLN